MSFTDKNKNCGELFKKNSSDSEENYQSEVEISDENLSESISEFKNVSIEEDSKKSKAKRYVTRSKYGRLNVSLRYGKSNRCLRAKNKCRKLRKKQKLIRKSKNSLEKQIQNYKKGKRCRLGGKAKGKPPSKESLYKRDSEDESDNSFFGRVSLGYFQKFIDHSGASTSYQWEEDHKNSFSLKQRLHDATSEEMELLELQKWGMTGLASSSKKDSKLDKTEDIEPDIF